METEASNGQLECNLTYSSHRLSVNQNNNVDVIVKQVNEFNSAATDQSLSNLSPA